MIQLEFHGAAKTVTGSNYLCKTPHGNFIVDCGMFQGEEVEYRNLEEYAYDPSEVDFVLLTHAHLDHCGMLPKLFKGGFRGKIYATNHTIQISTLILLDSAKIQESNFRVGQPYGKFTNQVALVYNSYDAEQTINQFQAVSFNDEFSPMEGLKVKFVKAGHILGAASIEVDVKKDEGEDWEKILFSGDIGRDKEAFIDSFDNDYDCDPDYILIESLYGGQEHPDREVSVKEMIRVINETLERGGNVFIPCFAVQRTQDIMYFLKHAKESGELDNDVPVYLDSPLAQKVSAIYSSALESDGQPIFHFDNLTYIKKYKHSQALHSQKGNIIIAGSGMADGGRIMDHLSHGIGNAKNSVIFVGYQAEGTLGNRITSGDKDVTIGKNKYHVSAQIVYLHGFSAHGDTSDYLTWIKRFKSDKLKKVFLIHAEIDRAEAMQDELEKVNFLKTYIPDWKESVILEK